MSRVGYAARHIDRKSTATHEPRMWQRLTLLLVLWLAFAGVIVMFGRVVGFASPWMALPLTSCVLGLARVAEPAFRFKVPGPIHTLRPWELRGSGYRGLGVTRFGAVLRNTPLRRLNPAVYVSARHSELRDVIRQVESAEASHFWAGVLLVPYLVLCVWQRQWLILTALFVIELLLNVYPIMHLRSVRGRLARVAQRVTR
jgi:hypothetical protein